MARKKKNTVDYFPHLIQDGKTMFIIESKYKNDGYATWYKILERLGKSENHFIDLSDTKESMYLASKCNIDNDLLKSIITDLVDLGKFDKYLWENNIIWSQDFVDNIADVYKRRDTEIPTIRIICKQLGLKCKQLTLNDGKGTQSKVKDSKEKNEDVNEIIIEVVKHLNLKTKNNFSIHSRNTQQLVMDRMEEKYTVKDFIKVIDNMCKEWLNTDMEKWLRPKTLFSVENFDGYLQNPKSKKYASEIQPL